MTGLLSANFEEPLTTLGQLLAERGLRYVVALVDDGSLVSVAELPPPLQQAVEDTAKVLRLPSEWFNPGPRSLMDLGLPSGVLARAHRREWGGLVLHIADRSDQIFFKLYAAVDQGPRSRHFDDLRSLEPSGDELRAAARWARTHDPSEGFANELRSALREFGIVDGIA